MFPMAASEAIHGSMSETPRSKVLHVGLWVVQGLLCAAFVAAGSTKATAPLAQLQASMPWVNGAMGGAVRFIGAVEVLGAVGLIVPAATRIKPGLTPLAALGLTVVMVLAATTHATRGELPMIGANVVLGGMAAFVAWGRSRGAPIAPRS
jgi:uncharacterized membrane protein